MVECACASLIFSSFIIAYWRYTDTGSFHSFGFTRCAAFDTVEQNRPILIRRMGTSFEVTRFVLSWLQSYLSGRTQSVRIGGKSSPADCTSGLPQGSVRGPLLRFTPPPLLASPIPLMLTKANMPMILNSLLQFPMVILLVLSQRHDT